MAEFNLVTKAFKSLFDEITGLGALRTEQEVVKIRAELLREVAAAQQAAMNLQEENAAMRNRLSKAEKRIATLQRENERLQDWSHERDQFEVRALGEDTCAYMPKETTTDQIYSAIKLCANCFDSCQRSFLQFTEHDGRDRVLTCYRCKARVRYPERPGKFPKGPVRPKPYGSRCNNLHQLPFSLLEKFLVVLALEVRHRLRATPECGQSPHAASPAL